MRRRALLGSSSVNRYYIERGIKICDRWAEFTNFLADMGECPSGMSIHRIDSDGDYCPENCQWATPAQQIHERRDIKLHPAQVLKIVALANHYSRRQLAFMFKVSYACITDILIGRRWSSVTEIRNGGLTL